MDNPVVKEFETGIPYIPGSSLKGKIRFLLEKKYANNQDKLKMINNFFGMAADSKEEKEENQKKMTVVVIRDAFVDEQSRKKIEELKEQGLSITEEKYEVSLKDDGKPNPRSIERVPKGYCFDLEVVFRFYEVENEKEKDQYIKLFEEGLELLRDDYLGGSGTRGCGKVNIESLS